MSAIDEKKAPRINRLSAVHRTSNLAPETNLRIDVTPDSAGLDTKDRAAILAALFYFLEKLLLENNRFGILIVQLVNGHPNRIFYWLARFRLKRIGDLHLHYRLQIFDFEEYGFAILLQFRFPDLDFVLAFSFGL